MSLANYWRLAREAEDHIRRVTRTDLPPELKPAVIKFAESTVIATRWLMKYHPERLDEWFSYHHAKLKEVAEERGSQ